jgi:hypothetical protein
MTRYFWRTSFNSLSPIVPPGSCAPPAG